MFYSYKVSIQGSGQLRYLQFAFDRQLSERSNYRGDGVLAPQKGSLPDKLCEAIAGVKNIVVSTKEDRYSFNSSQLIGIDGNNVTVRVVTLPNKETAELAKTIVKRIQRIIAPGEGRLLVHLDTVREQLKKLNEKRGWGLTV